MKLTGKTIAAHIKSPAKSCVGTLIYGADEGQVREHAAAIASQVVDDPKDPFSCVEISDESLKTEPTLLYDELFAFNMLGGRRLVRLSVSGESAKAVLAEIYNADALPEAYLLVTAGELAARSDLRAYFEKHAKLAALPCYKDENYQLDTMIKQTLNAANIRCDREVVLYLAANLGSDRRLTRGELEKIVLYCDESGQLTLEEAIDLVGNSAELTLDDLCNALALGNIRGVDRVMQKLLHENTQPIQILRALQRSFLRLHMMSATMRKQRITADQVINEAKPKIFFKQVDNMRRQLGLWSLTTLEEAMLMLTKAEQACKTTGSDPEAQLQHYTTQILALLYKHRKSA
ncbi:MAG: DNA polymerase III subunit delta [Alphaproteobacteria bacterium]|nr:DNA polymerase III subunit delta [Alphaproteobacteria bacterium]